nr:hypothetical protein [Dendronalium sp. ChiSLP03b]MDZ8204658.1 hypothetical protein [Dendronalium sp. ChiSLP03b]
MKLINKLSPLFNNALKSHKGVVLTLALASLLSYGGLTENKSAAAVPGTGITQLSQRPQTQSNNLPRPIANQILRDASKRSGVPRREVKITQVTAKTFGNPCEFNFGEICTKEYNPIEGWEVVVRVRQNSWTYHVNKSGTQIVLDPKVSTSQTLPRAIANAILSDASKRSGVTINNLKITQATAKTFGNPCEFNFGEICTKEYNPIEGWEVVVRVRQNSWTYHVNKSGTQIVLDPKVSTSQTLPRAIANAILSDASKRSGVTINNLKITQATAKTFGNLCIFNFGEVCTREYRPIEGWEVVVRVRQNSWTYHVNKSGTQIVLDPKVKI